MKAVILAGGKGTRLSSLVKNIPKPLVKIGGKPVIEHQIVLLKRYGVKEVWILTGYMGEKIKKYFEERKKLGVRFYYYQEKKLMGTAGALKVLEGKIKDDFLIISGDIMLDINIKRLVDWHKTKKGIATFVVHPSDHPFDSDLVEVNKNKQIVSLLKRPHSPKEIFHNTGIASVYIFSPKVFKYISGRKKSDIEKNLLPLLIKSKERIYGYSTPEYIKDIGVPERLFRVRKDFFSGKIYQFNLENKRKAVFLDRDGVICEEVDQLYKLEDLSLYKFSGKAIKKINEMGYLAIIITNQPMIAKGFMTEDDLDQIHKKLETELSKEGAKIDAIYYCPHHPEKGFSGEVPHLKIKCKCRKPEIGLFLKAKEDFNIDFKGSYMIGDKTSDILAGKRAGCKTILVKTGYGGANKKFPIQPDFTVNNLLEGLKVII